MICPVMSKPVEDSLHKRIKPIYIECKKERCELFNNDKGICCLKHIPTVLESFLDQFSYWGEKIHTSVRYLK